MYWRLSGGSDDADPLTNTPRAADFYSSIEMAKLRSLKFREKKYCFAHFVRIGSCSLTPFVFRCGIELVV